jgi:hypothetical protein
MVGLILRYALEFWGWFVRVIYVLTQNEIPEYLQASRSRNRF